MFPVIEFRTGNATGRHLLKPNGPASLPKSHFPRQPDLLTQQLSQVSGISRRRTRNKALLRTSQSRVRRSAVRQKYPSPAVEGSGGEEGSHRTDCQLAASSAARSSGGGGAVSPFRPSSYSDCPSAAASIACNRPSCFTCRARCFFISENGRPRISVSPCTHGNRNVQNNLT